MTPLQRDSVGRIVSYQIYRDEAKKQGKVTLMRRWIRALEEEHKILAMIKRVEAFNASNNHNGNGDEKPSLSREALLIGHMDTSSSSDQLSEEQQHIIDEYIVQKSRLQRGDRLPFALIEQLRPIVFHSDLYFQARNRIQSTSHPKETQLLTYLQGLRQTEKKVQRLIESGKAEDQADYHRKRDEKIVKNAIESGRAKDKADYYRKREERTVQNAIESGRAKDKADYYKKGREARAEKAIESGKAKDKADYYRQNREKVVRKAIESGRAKDQADYYRKRDERIVQK